MLLDAIAWLAARTTVQGLVAVSFVPLVMVFVWALLRADRGNDSVFKLVHFVTNDVGRGSPYALGYTVLVIVCGWGVWALIVLDRLTEWYMTVCIGGFVIGALGSTGARTIAKIKGASDPLATAGDATDPPAAADEATSSSSSLPRRG